MVLAWYRPQWQLGRSPTDPRQCYIVRAMTLFTLIGRQVPRSLLAVALLYNGPLAAQRLTEHRLSAENELPAHGQKVLLEVLHALDEQGRISIEGDRVKVRCMASLDQEVLVAAFDASGLGPFTALPHGSQATGRSDIPPPFSVPPPTGNERQDRMAYEAAKREWATSHPEAYRAWSNALGTPQQVDEPDQ